MDSLDFYTIKRLIIKGALVLETFRFGRGTGEFHSFQIAWVLVLFKGPPLSSELCLPCTLDSSSKLYINEARPAIPH